MKIINYNLTIFKYIILFKGQITIILSIENYKKPLWHYFLLYVFKYENSTWPPRRHSHVCSIKNSHVGSSWRLFFFTIKKLFKMRFLNCYWMNLFPPCNLFIQIINAFHVEIWTTRMDRLWGFWIPSCLCYPSL